MLEQVERDHGVSIIFATESGSRAWGFPSADSDFDVRFVYAHRRDWYLSILEGRDVIELPLDAVLDIKGWDVRKALRLVRKSNTSVMEWLAIVRRTARRTRTARGRDLRSSVPRYCRTGVGPRDMGRERGGDRFRAVEGIRAALVASFSGQANCGQRNRRLQAVHFAADQRLSALISGPLLGLNRQDRCSAHHDGASGNSSRPS